MKVAKTAEAAAARDEAAADDLLISSHTSTLHSVYTPDMHNLNP
jgi:hypothetical protein